MLDNESEMLPYSESCERNKRPILSILSKWLTGQNTVWEIGSGTGQHAEFFAMHLPHLSWQPTEMHSNLDPLILRCQRANLMNLHYPLALDVSVKEWPEQTLSVVFTANTFHIMSESVLKIFFQRINDQLMDGGVVFIYGPFKYQNEFTSISNKKFDQYLKEKNKDYGIRDFEWVKCCFNDINLDLLYDYAMPANNQLQVWKKSFQ